MHPAKIKETTLNENPTAAISGLHIVANFGVANIAKLDDYAPFKNFITAEIEKLKLTKVGEVYHNFPGGGYTAVICLTESHISIHTWPELQYLTFDVYLSNYMKDNRPTTKALYESVKHYFDAIILFEQSINR